MTNDTDHAPHAPLAAEPKKMLSDAAKRALAEAEARRQAVQTPDKSPTEPEIDGPSGPEPTRYGDWERKGLAVDF